MAKNESSFGGGNFGIESTESLGNQELLENLLSPETTTTSEEQLETIVPGEEKQVKKPVATTTPTTTLQSASTTVETTTIDLGEALLTGEEEEEEESGVEKGGQQKNKDTVKKDENENYNPFESFSKELFNLGAFSKGEEEDEVEITTPEQFLERFNFEKKKGAVDMIQNFLGQFGDDRREIFQAIFEKGVEPREYLSSYVAIQNYAEMDLTKEENQIAVVRQFLGAQEMETEDINAEIERLKNFGDLEVTAQRQHKILVKKEASKLQEIEQEKTQELQRKAAAKVEYLKNVDNVLSEKIKAKEFDGIPINPKIASELKDFLITDKYRTATGETLTEFDKAILELKRPENHEKKVKIALLMKMLEKDPTLSTIQKTAITKKTDQLFGDVVRQTTKKAPTNSTQKPQPKSWF